MIVRIRNLRLRVIVGVYEWEQTRPQEVTVSIEYELDASRAVTTDDISDTVDYKAMKKRIMDETENARFNLLEKLASDILAVVMRDEKVLRATVEASKPSALRFTDSVSAVCSARRDA
jgi:FolB domain-containing protein